ncbi:protein kinase domain protein [Niveomyces insectorum RCEF 264]|uniref:non-specific serine/threonine protein kinase n=1 Tax=Niveomyces insectorum RCEF 264 TaxID=1081102 RepID=A0A167W7E3_9HYPO|nr:protein kinase domain protein [Niveomyces insectorum RCEF 264]
MSSRFEYKPIWGVESLEDYKKGGYHPVTIGDTYNGRYLIVDKLGYGGYSTVWLARDNVSNCYVALKVGISESDLASQESYILRSLLSSPSSPTQTGRDCIPQVFDEFDVRGPNGSHHCYTMTLGRCSLRQATEIRMFPLEVARVLSRGLASAVAYIHARGYVHGDIHLGNVLARMPSSLDDLTTEQLYKEYGQPETVPVVRMDKKPLAPGVPESAVVPLNLGISARDFTLADARILLSDFGEAFSPANGELRTGEECHCPVPLRPPETLLEPASPMSYPADIWMLGMAIWNIIAMKSLVSNDFPTEDEVVSQHIDILGPLPAAWQEVWATEYTQHFDDAGQRRCPGQRLWPSLDVAFEEGVQVWRRKQKVGTLDEEEAAAFLRLIRQMLAYRPEDRPTAEQVLESEWMVRWATTPGS